MNYNAQLDGFSLEIKSDGIQDTWEKNVVEYGVPFSAGAQLDSLGLKARATRFTAIFKNANYEMHEAFVQHCILDLVNTFVHPVYGPVKGMVKNISVLNRDLIKYAEVAFDFVEDANPESQPLYRPDVTQTVEATFIATQTLQMESVADALRSNLGASAAGVLSISLDPSKSILSQVQSVSMAGRAFIGRIDDAVNMLDAALTSVTNPAESLIAAVEYGTSIPGRVIGSIAYALERYSVAAVLSSKSPLSFVNSFRTGVQNLVQSAGPLRALVLTSAALVESVALADLYKIDDENRTMLARVESMPVWAPDGTQVYSPAVPQVLSVNELEKSLQINRENVQSAIAAIRAEKGSAEIIAGLKTISAALVDYIDQIKLEREKIVKIYIDTVIPVHLLCLQYGLSYMSAERICALNNFWNPNFCYGDAQVYVGQN